MFKVIIIGDIVLDTHLKIDDASVECGLDGKKCKLCLDYAAKVPVTDSFQTLGGNAANVSLGTQKLGLETAILSTIGDDNNGQTAKEELQKFSVDTQYVFADTKSKTRYSVILNFQGERTILSYHKKHNYIWPEKIAPADWIYYTSLSEGFTPLQTKLLAFLSKHPSVRLAFNPGSFQLKNNLKLMREILPHTDLLIVNLEEAELLADITLKKSKDISALIHKLLQAGAKEVVITDAGRGAWAGNKEIVWHLDAFPVQIISKTGAGDAFSAGYLGARIYRHDIPTCLAWGIANSCSVIGNFGVEKGLLNKNGIKKMIEKYKNIIPKEV